MPDTGGVTTPCKWPHWMAIISPTWVSATGTKAGNYAIIGLNWKANCPRGEAPGASRTNSVLIFGRTLISGPTTSRRPCHSGPVQNDTSVAVGQCVYSGR